MVNKDKVLLSWAIILLTLVVMIYASALFGIQFTNIRLKAASRLAIVMLPWISMILISRQRSRWLKISALLIAIPQLFITTAALLFTTFYIDLPALLSGDDPDCQLIQKQKMGTKYLCRYRVGMRGGATVGVIEENRYETPIFPGVVKIEYINKADKASGIH